MIFRKKKKEKKKHSKHKSKYKSFLVSKIIMSQHKFLSKLKKQAKHTKCKITH